MLILTCSLAPAQRSNSNAANRRAPAASTARPSAARASTPARAPNNTNRASERANPNVRVVEQLSRVQRRVQSTGTQPGRNDICSTEPLRVRTLKNEEELSRYIGCYLPSERDQKKVAEYRQLIQLAAAQFEVPATFLTCLIMRESKWFDPNAVSRSNAVGLGQIMPDTAEFIDATLKFGSWSSERFTREHQIVNDTTLDRAHRDRSVANVRRFDLAIRWRYYYTTLKEQGFTNQTNSPKDFTLARSTRADTASARDPKAAIGASALYLRYIMELFEENLPDKPTDAEFLSLIAGAYNMGPRGAIRALRDVRPRTLFAWRKKLREDNEETRNHIDSILACMQSNNFGPMVGTREKVCE